MLPPIKILNLNFFYHSNFPIKSNFNYYAQKKNLFNKKMAFLKNDKKICKNFFLLILFLKYLNLKLAVSGGVFFRYRFFIKPNRQNIFNYLRAPYKNKLARNQVYIPRYKFSVNLSLLTVVKMHAYPYTHYSPVLNFFKKNLVGISSNIFYLNKIKINYKSVCKNF